MKQFITMLFLLVSANGFAQKGFTISGDVSKVKDLIAKVYLNYYADGKSTMDSAEVKEGKFSFTGTLARQGPQHPPQFITSFRR